MRLSLCLVMFMLWPVTTGQTQVVRSVDLNLSNPKDLAEIIEKAQETLGPLGGCSRLGAGHL